MLIIIKYYRNSILIFLIFGHFQPVQVSIPRSLYTAPPLPHFCVRSCLSNLPTSLTWRAGSAPSLLSLQVFLVADRAHAVGAGVTVETASHGAKHWHLGLIGLLSHAVTEGQGGWERISLGKKIWTNY